MAFNQNEGMTFLKHFPQIRSSGLNLVGCCDKWVSSIMVLYINVYVNLYVNLYINLYVNVYINVYVNLYINLYINVYFFL